MKGKTIYLCLAHMSEEGLEQKYVKEAFDTNWVVPMGPNVNAFEQNLSDFANANSDGSQLDCKVVCLSAGTAAVHLVRSATFGTEIWIRNQTDRKVKDLTVEINLVGKDNRGNKLDKKMVAPVGTIQAFSETSVTLSEMLREPQLWSAEKPHLYDIHIKLRRKNELLESFEYLPLA